MKKITSILLLTLVMQSCCEETVQPTELPDATGIGKGTLGCHLDGEIFVNAACTGWGGQHDIRPLYSRSTGNFWFHAKNNHHFQNDEIDIIIEMDSIPASPGIYTIPFIDQDQIVVHGYQGNYYYIDSTANNYLDIKKFDTTNMIVSGFFEFSCVNYLDSMDVIHLSDGRFDLGNLRLRD